MKGKRGERRMAERSRNVADENELKFTNNRQPFAICSRSSFVMAHGLKSRGLIGSHSAKRNDIPV